MTEKHEFEKFLTLELIAERYDMCTVDNLKHVLLNFRKHVILLCCFAMSPAVLLLHDDKDDIDMHARSSLSPVAMSQDGSLSLVYVLYAFQFTYLTTA